MSKFQVVARRRSSKKISPEEEGDIKEEERTQSLKDIKAADKLVALCCRRAPDSLVDATRNNYKYCYVYKYNDDPDRGELKNELIGGVSAKRLLSLESGSQLLRSITTERDASPSREDLRSSSDRSSSTMESMKRLDVSTPLTPFTERKNHPFLSNGVIVGRAGLTYR